MWKLWTIQNTDYHLAFKDDSWPKPKTEHTYFVPALAEQSLADAAFKSLKNEGGAGRIRQAYYIAWDKKNRVTVPSVSSQENRHLGSYRQKTCLAALINGLLRGQQL